MDIETKVYSYGGRVAHIRVNEEEAICGHKVTIGNWFGTGSQKEYDKAAGLPLCKDCEKFT